MLCAPPFVKTSIDVMRSVVFNPGIKENAGIFNHTQGWGRNPDGVCHGVRSLTLNGVTLSGNLVPADELSERNQVRVILGRRS